MNKPSILKKSRSINDEQKYPRSVQILTSIINMVYFGLGIAMLAVGILYLSVYKYDYSFTSFNPTLMSGIFISFGIIIMALAILNIVLIQLNQNKIFLIVIGISSLSILVLFIVVISLSIWGLSIQGTDVQGSLSNEARLNILHAIKNFDYNSPNQYENKAINYLQSTFKCCGIDQSIGKKINILFSNFYFKIILSCSF
jgi:hypothetical protein